MFGILDAIAEHLHDLLVGMMRIQLLRAERTAKSPLRSFLSDLG